MSRVEEYLNKVIQTHNTGSATEHSYRPAIQALVNIFDSDIKAINEPKRVDCGAPDFLVQRGDIVIGHIEAKDIGIALQKMKGYSKDQQERYRNALPNLIYTNCLDWDFYRDGELVTSVSIADISTKIEPHPNQFETLENLLKDFIAQQPISITHPKDLAERMAGKAQLIKNVFFNALTDDRKNNVESDLTIQFETFAEHLIHDIEPDTFADIYAETICYGMFGARLHDATLEDFSRQEALELLPKSNPFLRNLFSYVAGPGLDDRVVWIIDDLADVFRAANVAKIMDGFGKLTGQKDPFLHFYETFLAAYNPAKRKARGVWYTPEPVVNFIVRAVDEVLQTEFGLADGLADTSKVSIDWDTGQRKLTKAGKPTKDGKNAVIQKEVHRVQILDPATGTGTFLAEALKQIAPKVKGIAPGMWSSYIEQDLIPRLHGFELLMASYAMCHMKLDMMLAELGYQPSSKQPRLSVYLTNSLEEGDPPNYTLPFARWLSEEVKQANTVKRDMPIMCVIGNPPYLGEGGVSEGWLGHLMDDYKKEPGGKQKLKERNPKWINDLYVKFIRMSSHQIEKNGEGVLGFITNHGYLDNPTFRGMRWHLLKTFDKIWVLDLHGNTKKKEIDPNTGKLDKNVFDIQQGVAIIIAVKKKDGSNDLAEVMHGDLWGDRDTKYKYLNKCTLTDNLFETLKVMAPRYPLVQRDWGGFESYQKGFSIHEFMPVNSVGIVTARDKLTIDHSKNELWERVNNFVTLDPELAREKYRLGKDVRDWQVRWAQEDVRSHLGEERLTQIAYRPFDTHWTFYTGNSRGFMCYPRGDVMQHMLAGENMALLTSKAHRDDSFAHVSVCQTISEVIGLSPRTASNSINFPLYLYPDEQELDQTRRINFDPKLYEQLQALATHSEQDVPDEVTTFDYIYGVLHSPAYRKTYAEFLKSDFPRIPWPTSPDEFWDVSAKGSALRKLHLMEPSAIGDTPYTFEGEGDNVVDKLRYEDGKIWINKTQYFSGVPEVSWGFYIGGYQPARKWLKDRKGRQLGIDDVRHYMRIIKILAETDLIMGEIDLTLES